MSQTAASSSLDSERAAQLEEWKQARGTLQFFDDKLHDLRKYGFSFITVLLAAAGILLPSKDFVVKPEIKFAVFLVNLILILAVNLADRNYQMFQRAAAMRASVLERKLNLELSDTITERYNRERANWNVAGLYLLFVFGILLITWFSVYPDWFYAVILAVIAAVGAFFTFRMGTGFKYTYREDWTISPLVCTSTDRVTITVINLSQRKVVKDGKIVRESVVFPKGQAVWEIFPEEGGKDVGGMAPLPDNLEVPDSHTWVWEASKAGKGVYNLKPRGWPLPLHRRIIVV